MTDAAQAQLIYPAPQKPWRLSRFQLFALGVALVAGGVGVAVLVGWLFDWSSVASVALMGVFLHFLDGRYKTIVTSESITARGIMHTWSLEVDRAEEVVARNVVGNPVYVRTVDGRRRRLWKVAPEHMAEIGELTGLPVRDEIKRSKCGATGRK